MDQPLISIILCFLNPGRWLEEAVDSVIAQTYGNWELILVDDGSVQTDSERAKKYASPFPGKIRYTDHTGHRNIGLTASRNAGIRFANGSFIAFLDADDYWYPQKLAYQLAIFDRFPDAGMICEASQFWYSWDDANQEDSVIAIGAPGGLYSPGELNKLLYPLAAGQPPCPSGIMLKTGSLKRTGVFDEAFSGIFQLYEDQAFLAKMYLIESVYISATANNKYRKHANSMTSAGDNAELYNTVRNFYLDWLTEYLENQGNDDPELRSLILAARLPAAEQGPV
jgi:glycosyltransferase involved in cell wall biosynthesis